MIDTTGERGVTAGRSVPHPSKEVEGEYQAILDQWPASCLPGNPGVPSIHHHLAGKVSSRPGKTPWKEEKGKGGSAKTLKTRVLVREEMVLYFSQIFQFAMQRREIQTCNS